MNENYQITDLGTNAAGKELADFLTKEGQMLLPMVQLVEQAELAIDDLVDVMGRATIEAVLQMSAQQVAGPKQQGKAGPAGAMARLAGRSCGLEGATAEGSQAAAAQEDVGRRRGGGGAGVRGDAKGRAAGRSHAGNPHAGRLDASLRTSAAADGRPGGGEWI